MFICIIFFIESAYAITNVKGHYRSNGKYIYGYTRTSPNNNKLDNFSTKGNINPYTGKSGTVNPYVNYTNNYRNNHYIKY